MPPASSWGACHAQFPLCPKAYRGIGPVLQVSAFLKRSWACCFGIFFNFVFGWFCKLDCCVSYLLGKKLWGEMVSEFGYMSILAVNVEFHIHIPCQDAIMMPWSFFVLGVHWEIGVWCVGVLWAFLYLPQRGSKTPEKTSTECRALWTSVWFFWLWNWELGHHRYWLTTSPPRIA